MTNSAVIVAIAVVLVGVVVGGEEEVESADSFGLGSGGCVDVEVVKDA